MDGHKARIMWKQHVYRPEIRVNVRAELLTLNSKLCVTFNCRAQIVLKLTIQTKELNKNKFLAYLWISSSPLRRRASPFLIIMTD